MEDRNDGDGNSQRIRQQLWRERLPELHRIIEDVAPQVWASADEDRLDRVPEDWKALVSAMRSEVLAEAEAKAHNEDDATIHQRRGYYWSYKVARVRHMLEYLTRAILHDLGFEDDATMASIALLHKAALYLQLELQDGGTKEGREDSLENQCRLQRALTALVPRFDDTQLRRLRALQVVESAARYTRILNAAEIEEQLHGICESEKLDGDEMDRSRNFMLVDQPAMHAMMGRSSLVKIDERFEALDPLVMMEEFSDATADAHGGRSEGGEGRTGPARALARLCVMCGALGFEQREGEDFDTAAERVRNSLLVARSRIRKEIQSFPARHRDGEVD